MEDAAKAAFEAAKKALGYLVNGLQNIHWEDLPGNIKDHIGKNPKMTAFQIVMLIIAFVPGLVVAPALAAMGFGSAGPVAGKSWSIGVETES